MKGNIRPRFGSGAKLLATTLLGVGLLGLLAACGAAEPAATPTEGAAAAVVAEPTPTPVQVSDIAATGATPTPTSVGERPEYGGTFVRAESGLRRHPDPYHISGFYNYTNFNGLIQIKWPFNPSTGVEWEPYLSTEWSQSADGSKWIFKLRQGVTWHDGEAFNAADVVATVRRLLDKDFLIAARQVPMRNIFVGARKIDDYTVELDTGVANATALAYLRSTFLVMVPEHLVTGDPSSPDPKLRWKYMHPDVNKSLGVGTGPFKVTKWDPEVEVVQERNPNFFKFDQFGNKYPYLDRVREVAVPDGTRRLALYVAGTAAYTLGQGSGLHPDKAKQLCAQTRDKRCYTWQIPHGFFTIITNPQSTAPFKDGSVNAAARYAQNMDEIFNLAYGGRQGYMWMDRGRFPETALSVKEQYEVIPWSNPARRDEFVQKAKDLMDQAGYAKGFDMPYPVFAGSTGGLCSGSFLDEYSRHMDEMARVGIRGILECRQGVVGSDELKAGRWSIVGPGGNIFLIDPSYSLLLWGLLDSAPVAGPWRYEGQQELDDRFRIIQKTTDPEKRNQLFKDIERFMADTKLTHFPSGYSTVYLAGHGCVRDYRPGGTWESHSYSYERVWLEKECR